MFSLENITEYQFEITTYCNAACPQCPRNINGGAVNPYMPLAHLNRTVIDQAFTTEICANIRQVFFCGAYGDPIMHPDFLGILEDFRRKNPTVWLYVHTNGGVHEPEYWDRMARILNGYGKVDFGIDGLEDTLHLYRRNVKYNKVIENAQAFIQAGGHAQWNFIVFRHNEHQVEQAKAISKQLGFENILIRNTGRFFNHSTIEELPRWPVQNKQGKIEYYLEPPVDQTYRNRSMLFLPDLKKQYGSMEEYFNNTEIKCDALLGKKVLVNAQGVVLPCTFLNHMYDARFHEAGILPGANHMSIVNGQYQVKQFLESYGLDNLNIAHHSIADIFANPMWNDLIDSFSKSIKDGRLFECAMTCGSKLTKVWDQGGSKR